MDPAQPTPYRQLGLIIGKCLAVLVLLILLLLILGMVYPFGVIVWLEIAVAVTWGGLLLWGWRRWPHGMAALLERVLVIGKYLVALVLILFMFGMVYPFGAMVYPFGSFACIDIAVAVTLGGLLLWGWQRWPHGMAALLAVVLVLAVGCDVYLAVVPARQVDLSQLSSEGQLVLHSGDVIQIVPLCSPRNTWSVLNYAPGVLSSGPFGLLRMLMGERAPRYMALAPGSTILGTDCRGPDGLQTPRRVIIVVSPK